MKGTSWKNLHTSAAADKTGTAQRRSPPNRIYGT